jgi:hypothetical protein
MEVQSGQEMQDRAHHSFASQGSRLDNVGGRNRQAGPIELMTKIVRAQPEPILKIPGLDSFVQFTAKSVSGESIPFHSQQLC